MPTQFFAKTWIVAVVAVVFGLLSAFSVIMGPLFLFGIITPADGRSGTEGGIALTLLSVPLLLVFALAVSNILAFRKPLIRLYREGLEFNIIGASTLSGVPFIPGKIRVIWLIVSGEGFKKQTAWANWETLRACHVVGLPMMRNLVIVADFYAHRTSPHEPPRLVGNELTFGDAAFDAPLDQIAGAIVACYQNPQHRLQLPSRFGV